MHLMEGCDALRSAYVLPEALERSLSLDSTTPKTLHSPIIFDKYFEIISLNDVKMSTNTEIRKNL